MTTTSWHKLLGLGASAALLAAACTVSSGSDDDDSVTTGTTDSGGAGGSSTTSTSTATSSTSSGGSAGEGAGGTTSTTSTSSTTGEAGGTFTLECLEDADADIGTPASCDVGDDTSCCNKCLAENFCTEFGNCFATPANICGGTTDDDSEIFAFTNCMLAIDGGAVPGTGENSDFETCIVEDATAVSEMYCGLGTISDPTNQLATLMMGDEEGNGGCFAECLDSTFEEDSCIY